MKRYYIAGQAIHSFFGCCVLIISLSMALRALNAMDWEIQKVTAHCFFGFFTLFLVVVISILGLCAQCSSLYGRPKAWGKSRETHLALGRLHKWIARRLLIVGFITTSLGLARYQRLFNPETPNWGYLGAHVPLVLITAVVMESMWSLVKHYHMTQALKSLNKTDGSLPQLTYDEFRSRVSDKQQLMVLDNKILEIKDWEQFHPGGKWVLQKCVGRDISKFFCGSYHLLYDDKKNRRHFHSSTAIQIANDLTIAQVAN